ncbi:MAG TPA: hypothetical protein VFZ99_06575 [Terriglobales bacterium]
MRKPEAVIIGWAFSGSFALRLARRLASRGAQDGKIIGVSKTKLNGFETGNLKLLLENFIAEPGPTAGNL